MSYYSLQFGLFFAAVVALYFLAPKALRIPVLLTASACYYMAYVPQYIFILLALITIDFCAGLLIERAASPHKRKFWLSASLTANLGMMAAFKYSRDVFGVSLGVIPLGLSFHTFQSMAYIIEVYRGRQSAERSFFVYALYVLFFPQIAAGPIERPQNLLPQFRKQHQFSYDGAVSGLQLMAWGLFQKYVIAARLAVVVDLVYRRYGLFSGPAIAFTATCFAFQILCDFSGYSDIACGAAQVLGFRLTRNFNRPFFADSMGEYWKRWHISLSLWMRDYVFFPFCGNRPRTWRVCSGILLVFLANGLWHGARWSYLASGLLHAIYRIVEFLGGRAISRAGWTCSDAWERPLKIARTLIVFSLIAFAFIFFRSENLTQALAIAARLFGGWEILATPAALLAEFTNNGIELGGLALNCVLIAVVLGTEALQSTASLRLRIGHLPAYLRWGVYYAATALLLALARSNAGQFIYFQF